jgi:DNA-binding CsgD family transcriptional regulator/RNA polymerase-binding transcription factor DksA
MARESTMSVSRRRAELGERERAVLGLMVAGFRNRRIAERLSISERAVKFQVSNILATLEVGSRTEAIARVREYELSHRSRLPGTVPARAAAAHNAGVDEQRARVLLRAERFRLQELLKARAGEETDSQRAADIRRQLAALDRAQARLEAGTFGRSIRSGLPIGDERLEADPGVELTAEETGGGVSHRA